MSKPITLTAAGSGQVMNVSAQSQCPDCIKGHPVADFKHRSETRRHRFYHSVYGVDEAGKEYALRGEFIACQNFDNEDRHIAEPMGFYVFTWKPQRCRNGRLRWLRWLERHPDGTFTLGNRAH